MEYDKNSTPEAIAADSEISNTDKIKMLEQWEYDLREMAVAESENMPDEADRNQDSSNAELLRRVQDAKIKLGMPLSDEPPTEEG